MTGYAGFQRDDGTTRALVSAGEAWRGLAEFFVYRYFVRAGERGAMFEDAHAFAEGCFYSAPPSPNAWGALALRMSKAGLIVPTGVYRRSTLFENHARSATVWRAGMLPLDYPNELFGPGN